MLAIDRDDKEVLLRLGQSVCAQRFKSVTITADDVFIMSSGTPISNKCYIDWLNNFLITRVSFREDMNVDNDQKAVKKTNEEEY